MHYFISLKYEDQFAFRRKNLIVSIVGKRVPKTGVISQFESTYGYAIRFSFLTSHKHHTLEM